MEGASRIGIIILVVGVVVALLSAFADEAGVGAPGSGFGRTQLLATVLGCVILLAGVYLSGLSGLYIAAAGILMVVLLLIIDKVGVGAPGFGSAQLIALLTGAGVVGIGGYLACTKG